MLGIGLVGGVDAGEVPGGVVSTGVVPSVVGGVVGGVAGGVVSGVVGGVEGSSGTSTVLTTSKRKVIGSPSRKDVTADVNPGVVASVTK